MTSTRPSLTFTVALLFFAFSTVRAEGPKVEFLGVEAAGQAIVDESVEPYFTLLNPLEMTVKTGEPITGQTLEEQRAECRKRYTAAVLEFTDKEKETLAWYIERLAPALREHYPKFAALPWRFIKVSPRIEGGLPHTRGDQIILSPLVLPAMELLRQASAEQALPQFGDMLVHEQMHVMQRLNPKLFADLYVKVWGFERVDRFDLPTAITGRLIVNPDGVDLNWVYPIREGGQVRRITPRIVFAEGVAQPRMPRDFRMIAVDLDKMEARPLHEEAGYIPDLRRGPVSSIYHPNEIAADMFAHIVTVEHFMPPGEARDRAQAAIKQNWDPTREWFAKAFEEPLGVRRP